MPRFLVLVAALTIPLIAAAATDPRETRVDALFAAWNREGSPGCVTGVMSKGALIYSRGYGFADVEHAVPLSPDTIFDIASMTKQFTGASIGLLILDRKLAPADDVRERFPELHLEVPVTIDNLLHHTSGLRDYAELNQLRGIEPTDNNGVLALLARQKTLNFAPGSEYAYSNSNYVVLAELIHRVTGRSLAALAQERIFAPLKMQSTRYADALKSDPASLAISYAPRGPGQFMPIPRAAQAVGDGNLLTTVRDLAAWDENFYTNRVGGTALAQLVRAPARLADGKQAPYGFGLMIGEYRGATTEQHGGSYHGFRTELLRFPQHHFSVSVLCNVASANASVLASKVADMYLADVLEPQPSFTPPEVGVNVDPETLDAYAGDYAIDFGGPLTVVHFSHEGDRFMARSAMDAPTELVAASETEFFPKSGRSRVTFERDGVGTRVTLHLQQGDFSGRRAVLSRTSAELLSEVPGAYYSPELDSELRLENLNGVVFVDVGHDRKFAIAQIADSRFVMPGGATLEFVRDADGRITGLEYSSSRVRKLQFARKAQ